MKSVEIDKINMKSKRFEMWDPFFAFKIYPDTFTLEARTGILIKLYYFKKLNYITKIQSLLILLLFDFDKFYMRFLKISFYGIPAQNRSFPQISSSPSSKKLSNTLATTLCNFCALWDGAR